MTQMFELWSQDEYGQGSIIQRGNNLEELIKKAKQEVQELNVNNALTSTEKMRNWEAYFVEPKKNGFYYAGNRPDGKHRAFKYAKSSGVGEKVECSDMPVRLYLGDLGNKEASQDWYATTPKGEEIDSLSKYAVSLEDKTMFFIKPI